MWFFILTLIGTVVCFFGGLLKPAMTAPGSKFSKAINLYGLVLTLLFVLLAALNATENGYMTFRDTGSVLLSPVQYWAIVVVLVLLVWLPRAALWLGLRVSHWLLGRIPDL